MTRARMIEILTVELERSEGLPPNAHKFIADLRDGIISPGFEAVLRFGQRVEIEADAERK